MTRFLLPLALSLATLPAFAQEAAPPAPAEEDEGFSLMQEGARLLFEGLWDEVDPAVEGMGEAVAALGPMVGQLFTMMGDVANYQAPERLPNGDIILRRRPDAPPYVPTPEAEPALPPAEGEIDL